MRHNYRGTPVSLWPRVATRACGLMTPPNQAHRHHCTSSCCWWQWFFVTFWSAHDIDDGGTKTSILDCMHIKITFKWHLNHSCLSVRKHCHLRLFAANRCCFVLHLTFIQFPSELIFFVPAHAVHLSFQLPFHYRGMFSIVCICDVNTLHHEPILSSSTCVQRAKKGGAFLLATLFCYCTNLFAFLAPPLTFCAWCQANNTSNSFTLSNWIDLSCWRIASALSSTSWQWRASFFFF